MASRGYHVLRGYHLLEYHVLEYHVLRFLRHPLRRGFSTTRRSGTDYTHVIIGGGVVGLAVARQLSLRPGTSTVLLERRAAVGTETSSRNSEVIHAGIYYPPRSLKTRLCVRGRRLTYELCAARAVAHARVGKWLVAQTPAERDRLENIRVAASACDRDRDRDDRVRLRWLSAAEAAREEPDVRAVAGVLVSPETGLVDSHGLMTCLRGLFEDRGGEVALMTDLVAVRPLGSGAKKGSGGWALTVRSGRTGRAGSEPGPASSGQRKEEEEEDEQTTVTSEVVINAAGLGAVAVHNMLYPDDPSRHRSMYFAKGTYFSYGTSRPRPRRLIYPAPSASPAAAGLGTHLTLDLAGRVRFGPDVEWVDSADDLDARPSRLTDAVREIRSYLPAVDPGRLVPDYAGIRPKLRPPGAGFQDFVVDLAQDTDGWVDLLGIESPGLTSALAIAERVDAILYGSQKSGET